MKEIANGVSLLLLIQGIGGIINRLAGGGPSWFLVNYIDVLQGYEIIASIVLVILGAIIAHLPRITRKRKLIFKGFLRSRVE
jgi:hypothetical protein